MPVGKTLRVETLTPAVVHWSADDWKTVQNVTTRDTGLGVHTVDLATEHITEGGQVVFTFHWTEANRWEGTDFAVRVGSVSSGVSTTNERSEANDE
jgi:glucoamylase